ncbi:cytochrome bd-I oxidase subunit CydX [Diaphorobacter aerolatus]|uniref:Cytochrome bd-I oxidase subunit CydX n=1 Tax=Diaphorobacter aerolatus TaxID=1288495 RepID=A0A7H0GMB2_9BURK|nr:cytochrome bd-I oxidase subunit CydX [Diaphorobacter aerolatus]QNP49428.1 cytochrome bd-I oxidase subunit CydX [Diaphorobacter aerolatus]
MWYFSWLLGLPLAALFAVLNAMWFELTEDEVMRRDILKRTEPK